MNCNSGVALFVYNVMNIFSTRGRKRLTRIGWRFAGMACALVVLSFGVVKRAVAASAGKAPVVNLSYATEWDLNQSNPELAAFNAWANLFVAESDPAARAQMVTEGLSLAAQRRIVLKELISANPRKALAHAVPASIRQQLPPEIAAQLESRISGIGDYSVLVVCQENSPLLRYAQIDGVKYTAKVYGRRSSMTSKRGVPLHGIAIDGVLALHEGSVRSFELGESPDPADELVDTRTQEEKLSPDLTPVLIEAGGKIYRLASADKIQEVERDFESAEAGINPSPSKSVADVLISGGKSVRGPRNQPTPWTTGKKGILYIRVDFSDIPGDPVDPVSGNTCTAAYCQNLADTQVSPYYARSSYGLTTLSNVVTTQLYRLPRTGASYATSFTGNNDLHTDARNAAAANYNVNSFDRIVVLFPNLGNIPGSFITYGGLAQLGDKDVWVNGEFDFRVVAHELGHTYGLLHAGLWQVSGNDPIDPLGFVIEYGDDYDTMGANFANDFNTDFNPYFKNMLGWLSDSQVRTVTTAGGTFRTHAFDWGNYVAAPTNQILALKFVKDAQTAYWLGVRRNSFTNNPYITNGVYVMWGFTDPGFGGGGGFQSALLDLNTPGLSPPTPPAPPGVNTDFDAALAVNATFSDLQYPFIVRPIAKGGLRPNEYVDIQINGGGVTVATNYISGGNGNGVIDVNECNDLFIVLTNLGLVDATQIRVTLSTSVPGAVLGVRNSGYVDMPPGGGGINLVPFTISTAPSFACGTPIPVTVVIKTAQTTINTSILLNTGSIGTAVRYDSAAPVTIPDGNLTGVDSLITVSNATFTLANVGVSVYITHPFVGDLSLELIGPDGTSVPLSVNRGSFGDNYGAACTPDSLRTLFDDRATIPIASGTAPFIGMFLPETPLSVFRTKSGTNINGIWRLRVVDSYFFDAGSLQCWSLHLSPPQCDNGGGTCPGADLALGMKAAPEPVFLGSNLVYTVFVTNNGPSAAANTVVNQFLPVSVVPVNVVPSQGSANFSGNTMIGNLGSVGIGSVATLAVTVTPALAGTIVSSANVTSTEPDPDGANNGASVTTHVIPPTADISVTIIDNPDPAIVGGLVTYSVTVTNLGPSVASGVMVTNTLTPGLLVNGASSSQGSLSTLGNVVTANIGNLVSGAGATISVTAIPTVVGVVSMTTRAGALQADPISGNNIATASTTVSPAADLGIVMLDTPDPVVVRSNWSYLMVVTNGGPTASANVVVNATLPPNVSVVSSNASQGSVGVAGNAVTANLGTMFPGTAASVTVVVNATNSGIFAASATVTGAATDPATGNNSAAASTTVSPPTMTVVAAGATLTAESVSPANGALDLAETVTVTLRLRNVGNVSNTNLMATLQATSGVTAPSPATPVNYGVLAPSGLPVGRSFTFTASGTNGGTVTATLQLTDGGNPLPPVNFSFSLPTLRTFANTNFISITDNQPIPWPAGPATPYPSTNFVSGVTGLVGKVTLTLSNLNHSFPDDIDAVLVGPAGQKVVVMSDAGGGDAVNNINVTMDDSAVSALPDGGALSTGSYRPADYEAGESLVSPAPAGPYATTMAAFAGLSPNGTWKLYIADDSTGDPGNVAKGWSLAFSLVSPVNQISDLGLSAIAAPNPALLSDSVICTYTITNAGPNPATGVGFTNIVPGNAVLLGAAPSQGGSVTNGNTVTASLGTINVGATATVTVIIKPLAGGALNNPGSVGASENDLNPANNTASASLTVNLPFADAGVSQTATNGPGANVTLVITATNQGPQSAINILTTDVLPAGLTLVSSSAANITNNAGTITVGLGDLVVGSSSTYTLTLSGIGASLRTNVVSVSTASSDTNAANNTHALILSPYMAAAGAVLTSEAPPANGAVDAGETVTVSLSLQNIGTVDTASLVATLQASDGVTPITTSRNYGALARGGAAVSRSFTFTANGGNGGIVLATLQLQDGANNLGTVTFAFQLATTATYVNTEAITIPDHGPASPYPSTIEVSGLTGLVNSATVVLNGVTHGFPDDVDVLLVGPTGQKLVLMSDAGGGYSISNLTLTFTDAGNLLPDAGSLSTASFAVADYEPGEPFPTPAPDGPSGGSFAAFNASNPNGTWSLYVADDTTGDAGQIAGGWSLTLKTLITVNPIADLKITMSDAPDPVLIGNGLTYTIGVINHGPQTATGVLVTDALHPSLTYVSSTTSQGVVTNQGNTVIGVLGDLANGASATLTFRVTSATGGSVVNSVSVSAAETDLNSGDNTAQVLTMVSVPLTVTLTEAALVGGQIKFTLNGHPNTDYQIQVSTNLTTWTTIGTQTTAGNGQFQFTDPTPPSGQRYYRGVRVLE